MVQDTVGLRSDCVIKFGVCGGKRVCGEVCCKTAYRIFKLGVMSRVVIFA